MSLDTRTNLFERHTVDTKNSKRCQDIVELQQRNDTSLNCIERPKSFFGFALPHLRSSFFVLLVELHPLTPLAAASRFKYALTSTETSSHMYSRAFYVSRRASFTAFSCKLLYSLKIKNEIIKAAIPIDMEFANQIPSKPK